MWSPLRRISHRRGGPAGETPCRTSWAPLRGPEPLTFRRSWQNCQSAMTEMHLGRAPPCQTPRRDLQRVRRRRGTRSSPEAPREPHLRGDLGKGLEGTVPPRKHRPQNCSLAVRLYATSPHP